MPEICDLEVFKDNLKKVYKNKKLEKVVIGKDTKIKSSEKEFNDSISEKTLKDISRHAKELYFNFGENDVVSMHLMLHGQLSMPDDVPEKFIIAFIFEGVKPLVLSDYQKVANVTLNPKENNVVDALSKEMTAEWLEGQLQKKKAAIKTVLTDPKVIGGIGNAYVDEILWEARIAPDSVAMHIPKRQVHQLAKVITTVIHDSIKKIKETHPDIISGEIRDFMAVHNHKRKTSPTGEEILTKQVGGKTTYYTNEQVKY
ncbi:DNA-formamidopyrimidine glycosylase family protein [Dyadobacter arcticus]|uniref:Formamidopyrimidine-DNA glycosylase n=1 Tax=Dyadobacter arcticus TaxID=1078754 RepID=A0ABX0UP62_9BACT|nr:DNA-formamidopyrimidine glycosylase family protein [Dyadobacter arcticus]NIJ54769.1 formamidopyrimidine-DNA glycosylase [Dyadobacter arcticus]